MEPRIGAAPPKAEGTASIAIERRRHGDFERLILDIATRFNRLSWMDHVDEPILTALRDIATLGGFERAYLILLAPDQRSFTESHEWRAPGMPSFRGNYQDRPLTTFPWLATRLFAGETIFDLTLAEMPPEARDERRAIEAQGVKSFIMCPMFSGARPIGCLGFDRYTRPCAWPDDLVRLLKIAATIFAALLARRAATETFVEAERDLGLALAEAKTLQEALRLCLKTAIALSGMDSGGAYVVNADGSIDLMYHEGLAAPFVEAVRHFDAGSRNADLIRRGETFYAGLETFDSEFTAECRAAGLTSLAAVPVRAGGEVVACLNVASHSRRELPDAMRLALEDIGARIGAAIVRVRAEEALLLSERRHRLAADMLTDYLFRVRIEPGGPPVMEYVSENFQRITGLSLDKVVSPEHWAEILHPDDIPAMVEMIRRVVANAGAHQAEFRSFARRDGQKIPRWIEVSVRAQPDPGHGSVIAVEGAVRDITERKLLEERLRQTEKLEAIGKLAGGIAHDFNNQLTGIMGYAELLKRQLADPRERGYAEAILSIALRAADLAAQLLTFARKGNAIVEPVDLHDIAREVVSILAHSIDRRIRIDQRLDACPSWTMGDPTLLQTALLNLGLNARDAMPGGGTLVIATSVEELPRPGAPPDLAAGRYVRLDVTDTGVGMSAETQQHLFEPFFTTKERGKGTGLGLAAVYGAVKSHHGAITVRSAPGQGTTFSLHLPACEPPASVQQAAPAQAARTRGLRILLADDEEAVRESMAQHLRAGGHEVATAPDGAAALQRYETSWQEIDVVILDLMMPRMGGRDAFLAMRRINPALRALFISGEAADDQVQALLEAGVLGFLKKPFQGKALVEKIDALLPAG